jgi:aldehyde dehydrogenase (NAD+)
MTTMTEPRLRPEVETFLSPSVLRGVVGGRDAGAADGATFTTIDPGSGRHLAEVASMQAGDVDRAVGAATEAFRAGRACAVNERAIWIHRLADEIERRKIIGEIRRSTPARSGTRRKATCRCASTRCATSTTWP